MILSLVKKIEEAYVKFSPETKRVLKGSFWNIIGNVFSRILMMGASILIARWLGVEVFGKWGVIRSTTSMFAILMGFGIGVTATKHLAVYRDESPKRAERVMALTLMSAGIIGGILTLVLYIIAPFLAKEVLADATLSSSLRIASFFLILNAIIGVFSGALSGLECFSEIAFANFIATIVGVISLLAFTANYGLNGTIFGYVVFYFISTISLLYFLFKGMKKNGLKIKFKGALKEFPILYKFSLPAIISGSIGGPAVWICFAYVSNLMNGFAIIGIFSAARIGQNALVQLGTQLHSPLLSVFSNSKKSRTTEKLNMMASWVMVCIIAFPFICLPELISVFFNNSGYDIAALKLIITVTMFTGYVMLYKNGFGRAIVKHNKMWWGVYENIFWALALFSLVPIMTKYWGAVGLAGAFALAYFIDFIVISPFYIKANLIDRIFIFSKASIAVWLLVLGGVALVFMGVPIMLRLMYLLSSLILFWFCFLSIDNTFNNKEENYYV